LDELGSGTTARHSGAISAVVRATNGATWTSAIRPDETNNEPAGDESRR